MTLLRNLLRALLLHLSIFLFSLSLQHSALAEATEKPSSLSLYYFGIYYGPTLGLSDSLHPSLDTRNYLTLNSMITQDTVFGVTVGWNWQGLPAESPTLRDPFIKLGRSNLIRQGALSWYGDLRLHLPITEASRDRDLWVGMQTFHSIVWEPGQAGTALTLSARYNQFGGEGQGDDWEFYVGPSAFWNLSPRLGLNLLLEWGGGRPYGNDSRLLLSNGLDMEPGLNWRISDNILMNPYLTIPLDRTSLELTGGPSLGMTLSWQWL